MKDKSSYYFNQIIGIECKSKNRNSSNGKVKKLKKQKREMLKERLEKNKAHEAEDEGERKEE